MNIKITQSNSTTENVLSSVVLKLYNLATQSGNLLLLVGSIHVPSAYDELINKLNEDYGPDFNVTATNLYIYFADPEVRRVLLNNVTHAGEGITATECLAVANMKNWFKDNLNIVTFNEFSYFRPTSSTEDMFSGSSIRSINFSNLTKVSSSFCANSSLEGDISIPNLSGILGTFAFRNCSGITSASDLGTITKIEHNAFENCISLQSVTIPSSCIDISYLTFQGCTSLLEVIGFDNIQSLNESAFDGVTGLANGLKDSQGNVLGSLTYNSGNANQTSLGGFNFSNLRTLNVNALKGIGLYGYINLPQCTKPCGFGSNPLIKYINAPNAKFSPENTRDWTGAFSGCTGLLGVTLASQLTIIPNDTFKNCSNLTTLDMLGGSLSTVTHFGSYCFNGCSSFSIYNSDLSSATTIEQYAFGNVYKDTQLTSSTLTFLGQRAFIGTSSLETIDLSACTNMTSMTQTGVFLDCPNITSVKLPLSLTSFGKWSNTSPIQCKNNSFIELRGFDNVSVLKASITIGRESTLSNPICLRALQTGELSIIRAGNNCASYIKLLYFPVFKKTSLTSIGSWGTNNPTPNNAFFSYRGGELETHNDKLYINLLYFKDLEEILKLMFYGSRPYRLVINNTIPPIFTSFLTEPTYPGSWYTDWNTKMFGSIPAATSAGANDGMTIYVPDSAISTYQANANYNAYPIVGISSLTQYATEADWITNGSPVDGLITEYMT